MGKLANFHLQLWTCGPPGAEAFDPRNSNRVEEIRRRAAEIAAQRLPTPLAPVALPAENPLRQVAPLAPLAPEVEKVDTSKSPITDVWARFGEDSNNSNPNLRDPNAEIGDLLQEPLALAPFPQLQLAPPQFTVPCLGFCQPPQVAIPAPAPGTPGAPGAPGWAGPPLATPWMNLPTMMR